MKRARAIAGTLFAAIATLAAVAPPAGAQSVFSLQGPGVDLPPVDARGRAMGGVGLALADTLHATPANPALGVHLHQVTFGVTFVPSITWARDASHDRRWKDASISGVSLAFPLRGAAVIGTGIRVDRSTRATVRIAEERLGVSIDRTVHREGDHFAVPLTVAFGNRERWSAAIGMEYLFVSQLEEEDWSFDDPSYPGTHLETEENTSGVTPVAALALRPFAPLRLGFLYRHGREITGNREVSVEQVRTGGFDVTVAYPSRWGAGMALEMDRLTVAADLYGENWSDYHHVGEGSSTDVPTDDTWNWGVGLERPGASFIGSRSLRLGYRRSTLPAISFGDKRVREETFSLGGGWMAGGGRALIDLSLELAYRGNEDDNGARERIVRLGVSVTGREPWKEPSRRGPWWQR